MAPPQGVPIPQTAQAAPEGLGCICRYVGRCSRFNHIDPLTGCRYPPNDPGSTGLTRVHPPLCGQELEVQLYMAPNGESLSP